MCVCCVALPCGVHSLIFVLLVWYTELFTLCVGGWKMYESCSSSRCKYYSLYLWSIYIRSVGACTLSIHMHMSGKSSTSPKLYEHTWVCISFVWIGTNLLKFYEFLRLILNKRGHKSGITDRLDGFWML